MPQPKPRVLIVEDQADVRKLLRLTLAPFDWDVRETDNGHDAMRLTCELRPDAIILDVMLPGEFDGYQVCQAIKATPATAGTFVLILSARGQRWDIEEGRRMQADRYLVKPFSPLELIDILQRALGKGSGT